MSKKKNPKPAKVFGPGRVLRDEIAARGMTQEDLAVAIGRSRQFVNGLINDTRPLTFEVAVLLEAALEIDAEIWLRMEHNYRKHKDAKEIESVQHAVRRRLVSVTGARFKTARGRSAANTTRSFKSGKRRVASPAV
ncbi:MAG: helix-turn-helix domain-containing protein, partial [Armatimonadetes bacterium]|nr:helix-turn-helix domain-containing protein [Armatimonadota bacterium]